MNVDGNRRRASELATVVVLAAWVAVVAAACGGAATPPPVSDPRDLVVEALRSTAGLTAVHAAVELDVRDASGRDYHALIEGDVNVVGRELNLVATFRPPIFDAAQARLILADGFVASDFGQGWSFSGGPGRDPLQGVPTTARMIESIEGAVRDASTTVALGSTEPCGEARCHRVRVEVPAAVAWRAATNPFENGDGLGAVSDQPPPGFPGIAIDLWIDEMSHRLVQATNTTTVGGQTLVVSLALSRHGVPVSIELPAR